MDDPVEDEINVVVIWGARSGVAAEQIEAVLVEEEFY